eukprot:1190813-Prorocentrum_minimum.AAC.3
MDMGGLMRPIPPEDGGFNISNPISKSNEAAALTALSDSIESLNSWCAPPPPCPLSTISRQVITP